MHALAHLAFPRLRRLRRRAQAFLASVQGIAAVEFAMVLPVMVLMYLGMTELTFAVNTDRKITLLSRTLADLTGRATSMTTSEMEAIFGASIAVMAPYKGDNVKMVVSSIVVKDTGQVQNGKPVLKGTVCWSFKAQGAGKPEPGDPKGTVVTVPEGFQNADSSYIRADVSMQYVPVFGASVVNWLPGMNQKLLSEETPWPVRNVKEVVLQGTTPCLS
jgi:Flp pilus assembly protein TadG